MCYVKFSYQFNYYVTSVDALILSYVVSSQQKNCIQCVVQ